MGLVLLLLPWAPGEEGDGQGGCCSPGTLGPGNGDVGHEDTGVGLGGLILPLSRLLQVKLEREEFEEELRELRERFAAAREEADQARNSAVDPGELEALRKVGDEGGGARSAEDRVQRQGSPTPPSPPSQELRQARRELAAEKQSQEELLRERERELAVLKGTMREEASSRDGELERYRRDLQQLREERDEATKVSARGRALSAPSHELRSDPRSGLPSHLPPSPKFRSHAANPQPRNHPPWAPPNGCKPKLPPETPPAQRLAPGPPRAVAVLQAKASLESAREASEQARKTVESSLQELQEQNDDLRRKVLGMETQLKEYERLGENWEGSQARLKEKVTKLEVPGLRLFLSCPELFPCREKEFEEPRLCRQSAGRWRSRWAKPRSGSRSCRWPSGHWRPAWRRRSGAWPG